MAASRATVTWAVDVLLDVLQPEVANDILNRLSMVDGNRSYRETIAAMLRELERRRAR